MTLEKQFDPRGTILSLEGICTSISKETYSQLCFSGEWGCVVVVCVLGGPSESAHAF